MRLQPRRRLLVLLYRRMLRTRLLRGWVLRMRFCVSVHVVLPRPLYRQL